MKTLFYSGLLLITIILFNNCKTNDYDTFATLYGEVNDSATAEPLLGVSVVLSPGGKTKTTGTDGRFEFKDLDAAQYTITVQKAGYSTNRKTITAVVGESTEANIPMTKVK
ncbi:MAG: hypothetical protein HOO91_06600 [Bacteroidales bacterium]|nr:hypothetical protein [Bacteroidales bacterium]